MLIICGQHKLGYINFRHWFRRYPVFSLPTAGLYYSIELCHKHINLKKEKGPEPMVLEKEWEQPMAGKFLPEEEQKKEKDLFRPGKYLLSIFKSGPKTKACNWGRF